MASDRRPGLTDQQRRAVSTRGVSVALSAGAGCGKTFVLTARFLSHLEPNGQDGQRPARLGELVAITFTERAAREMRDRIRRACRQKLLDCPATEADYWLGLIRQLDAARVSTIHSFCGELLRTFAVEAGLDPEFRVLQQAQAEMLLYEVLDDQLRDRLAQREEMTLDLVVQFGLDPVRRMVVELLGRRQEIDWDRWQAITVDELLEVWQNHWRTVTLPATLKSLCEGPSVRTVLELLNRHRPSHAVMAERCEALVEALTHLPTSAQPSVELETIHENARVQGGGGKGAWSSEDIYNGFRDAASALRKAVEEARDAAAFNLEEARPAADVGLRVLKITAGVEVAYEREKQRLAGLDFDDLLIRTRRLLTDPTHHELQRRLADGIRLLLVDEFQDTDPLQVELVEALAGGELMQGKLFFVGDFKQSIYRFRGADPQVFRRLRAATPEEGRLPLSQNFRSQPAILDFVNALFCDDLGPEYEPLLPARPQLGPQPAIEFLWAPDETPEVRTGQRDRLRRQEAEWIARRLRAMLDSAEPQIWDEQAARRGTPALRPLRQGDIALLFRALSDVQYYEEALRRHEIDYYLVGGHAFYAQQEIFDLLNLLRSVASPCDEVSLAGVLRSPFFSLEDETLFWLVRHGGGLRSGLLGSEMPDELSREQRQQAEFAAVVLDELRRQKDHLPVADLIQLALDRTGYDAVLLTEFLGERKLANLRKLIDQARSLDRSGVFSIWDFITQLAEFVASQPKEPLAATHPESTDVVRLMTIHQSKGLEFPVVVLPDLDRRMQGPGDPIVFSRDLGPLVRSSGPSGYRLAAPATRQEELAEVQRLLYVATTRAADRLILAGGVPKLGATSGPWTELLGRRFDLQTGQLQAVLPAGYAVPPIAVVSSEPPLERKPVSAHARHDLEMLVAKATKPAARTRAKQPPWLEPIARDGAGRVYSFSEEVERLRADSPEQPEVLRPLARSGELDPRGVGSLVHAVLAQIDFDRPADVEMLVRRHAPWHLPGVEYGLDDLTGMIRHFLGSPRGRAVATAAEVYRELEFVVAWPPGTREPSPASVQGVIDCLYRDAAGWHLLDYKTHQVSPQEVAGLAAESELQLLIYGLAVEQLFGRPAEELVFCFLRPGVEHAVPWNAAARRRVVEEVGTRG